MAEFKNDVIINVKLDSADFQKNIDMLNDSISETEREVERLNNELANKDLGIAEREQLTQELEQQQATLTALNSSLDENTQSYQDNINSVAGLENKLSTLNQELKELEIGSDAFNAKVQEIGATEQQLAQANPLKKQGEEAAKALGAVNQAVGLLNLAFADNEKVGKVVQATLQGITAATVVANLAKEREAILATIQTVRLKALTVAQRIYATVVGRSTGAMKLFRVALAGTGIGAVVLLLGELIFNFEGVNKQINRAINYIRGLSDEISGGNKIIKAFVEIMLLTASPLVTIIRLIADFRGTLQDFQNAINDGVNAVANFADRFGFLGDVVREAVGPFNLMIDALKSLDKESNNVKLNLEGLKTTMGEVQAETDRANASIQQQINLLQAQGVEGQQITMLQREILINQKQIADENLKIAIQQKQRVEGTRALTKEEQDLYNQIVDAAAEADNELKILDAERNVRARENANERLAIERDLLAQIQQLRIGFIEDDLDRQEEQLRFERQQQAIANELQLQDLIKRYGKQSTVVQQLRELDKLQEQKFQDDLFDIEVQRLNAEIDANLEQQATIQAGEEASLENRLKLIEDAAAEETRIAQEAFINTGETQKERLQQEQDFQRELLNIRKKALQDQLNLAIQAGLEIADEFGNIPEEQQKLIDAIKQSIIEINTQLDNVDANIEIVTQEFADAFAQVIDLTNQVADQFASVVDASFKNQIANLEALGEEQRKQIEESTLTERQKAEQIEKLEREQAQKRYELELAQFEFNKAFQIGQTIINTAAGVVNALATAPFPVSVIQAAITAATGIAQIAIIASEPPPPKPSFEIGGYTGEGNPFETSTTLGNKNYTYHKGEYVVPNKVLRSKQGSALVRQLESMRLNDTTSLGLTGFADGGFTSSTSTGNVNAQLQTESLASAVTQGLQNVQIVTRVTDINRVNKNIIQTKAKSTLR